MHFTMGKDEYDKSQGGILAPVSPEHSSEGQSIPQGPIASNQIGCQTPKALVFNHRLPEELPIHPRNINHKRSCHGQSSWRTGLQETDLPKSCPSDLFFQTLDDKAELSFQKDNVANGPDYCSDSEELGLTTHRPLNVNARNFSDWMTRDTPAVITGQWQGHKDRVGLSVPLPSSWKKVDNPFVVKGPEEDLQKYHKTTAGNLMNRNGLGNGKQRAQSSPSQTTPNFVNHHMQEDYDVDDGGIAYHQPPAQQLRNYEQYVVPPNFAYTADDIYRNAFSVGSYPNLMVPKKMAPDMFSFVNALVSPPFFAPTYQPQQVEEEFAAQACQYYAAVNHHHQQQQSAHQIPPRQRETYAPNPVQPMGIKMGFSSSTSPSSSSTSYVDRIHSLDNHTSSSVGDQVQQHQSHSVTAAGAQGTNNPSRVIGQMNNWLPNGISGVEELPSSNLGTASCGNENGKPIIFRSHSFSAVEPSTNRDSDLSPLDADNYLSAAAAGVSPHHSSINEMENAFHSLHLHHSNPDNQYSYINVAGPPNANPTNGNVQIASDAHPQACHLSWEDNPSVAGYQQQNSQNQICTTPFSWDPRRHVPNHPDFYEEDVTDDTFCKSGMDIHPSSRSLSNSGYAILSQNSSSTCYTDGHSQSFPHAENYLSFRPSRLESYSDTEVYSKSPKSTSVHKFQLSSEYEDVIQGHPDVPSTSQAVFVMDEEIFSSQETNIRLSVPPLNLTDSSSDYENRHYGCPDHQEPFATPQGPEDGFVRPQQGMRYTCLRGPRKGNRKSGGLAAPNGPLSVSSGDLWLTASGAPIYKRHWEKSSNSWASNPNKDLNNFSSFSQQPTKNKSKDGEGRHQGSSPSNRKEQRKIGSCGGHGKNSNKKKNYPKKSGRPQSVGRFLKIEGTTGSSEKSPSLWKDSSDVPCCDNPSDNKELQSLPPGVSLGTSQKLSGTLHTEPDSLQDNSESELLKWHNGSVYPWHHLPDEIWLHIFSFLGNHDRFQCCLVSKQFHRIIQDESLWRHITLEKKMLQDSWLMRIAHLHPSTLELIQCHGDQVTAAGLSYLFNHCTDSLLKLRFSRCSRGELTGDNILLASTVCRNLTHVDASWCTVTDSGLSAIAKSCDRLESLCLNGCGLIADNGLKTLATLHGKSLKELEMFGCFNVTSRGIRYLASICKNLRILQLGQCYKLTDSCMAEVSSNLCCVENLDLRGCKQIKDSCIEKIVNNCSRLQTLALANCPNISNNAMQKIASTLPGIRSIDVCGCKLITDESVNRLAANCRQLVYLDISSTGCTYKSVCKLAEQGSTDLETLKLNFIAGITENSLARLTNHCKRLTTLHLYGCRRVRNLERLQALHPQLIIESDRD